MTMTSTELKDLLVMIGGADNEQLNKIIERVKMQRTWLANQTVRSVTIGDLVEFVARGNRVVRGTVSKVNRKTVEVKEAGSNVVFPTTWKVPASMLKSVA